MCLAALAVLVLDLLSLLLTEPEEETSGNGEQGNDADNDACGDACRAATAGFLVRFGRRRGSIRGRQRDDDSPAGRFTGDEGGTVRG